MELQTATPAEIDTALAEIYGRIYKAQHVARMSLRDHEFATKRFERTGSSWDERSVESTLERLEAAREALRAVRAETAPFDAEFARRGGWSRAWKVTNSNGHVHRTMDCGTCFPTTEFGWLPQISGLDEAEIVDLAGEAACSVCYPTAPVAPKPCRLFTADEVAAQAERDAKAAAKAEREAKRVAKALSADGSPVFLRLGGWREEIKTITTARSRMTDAFAWGWAIEGDVLTLAEMIAAKEGKTVETVLAEARKRAEKRR